MYERNIEGRVRSGLRVVTDRVWPSTQTTGRAFSAQGD